MTTKPVKVYVYAEHSNRCGRVVYDPERYIDAEGNVSADIWLWGDAGEAALISDALRDLRIFTENAAGAYRRNCASNVLGHLGVEVAAS